MRKSSIFKAARGIRILSIVMLVLMCFSPLFGQDITPVDIDNNKPEQPRLHYYDKHGNKLQEPVYFLAETDTVAKVSPASPWPLFNGVTVGVNFFDAAMQIAGQSYSSYDVHAAVSLHNWFFPTIECGVGFANRKEDDSPMVFRCHPSPYVKLGIDYNFLYKSTPDYMAGIGVRCGWSNPRYEITGATVSSDYWGQTSDFNIPNQSVNAWFGEALATVKVKIWERISMGWSIRYRFKIKIPDATNSSPWFIPGYGAGSPLSATFSLMYTFGGKREFPKEAED